jgi:RimJ/RimL family protein N-acetyltransferase
MQIAVRDTTTDDIDAIFRIRHDPLVVPHQYSTSLMGTIDDWRDLLAGKITTELFAFRSSTIVDGDSIVGHVSQWHMTSNDRLIVQCGWNLTPAYWGRGVMCAALTQLFSRFFIVDGVAHVFADCFRGNRRCIRLMDKLGFVPNGIPLHLRAVLAYSNRCFHWIKRFRLDAEKWSPPSPL